MEIIELHPPEHPPRICRKCKTEWSGVGEFWYCCGQLTETKIDDEASPTR